MRILFDVSHPAHVLFFREIAHDLVATGAEVRFAGRDKDATVELLAASGFSFEVVSSPASPRGRWSDALELVRRVHAIRRIVRGWRPDVLLTRNPSGVLATLGASTHSVFDTDDGRAVGLHYWLARPFAGTVTSSVHDPERHGRRHRRYPGLKAHAFLHPDRFRPDSAVLDRYGIEHVSRVGEADGTGDKGSPLFVVRFSAHDASHDRHIEGIAPDVREEVLRRLADNGAALVSVEGEPTELRRPNLPPVEVRADDFHHLLAHASLCVTDSQSVAVEAAILGVPSLRLSSFTGRVWYLDWVEQRFGLMKNLSPGEEPLLLRLLAEALEELPVVRSGAAVAAKELNRVCEDVSRWFVQLAIEQTGDR